MLSTIGLCIKFHSHKYSSFHKVSILSLISPLFFQKRLSLSKTPYFLLLLLLFFSSSTQMKRSSTTSSSSPSTKRFRLADSHPPHIRPFWTQRHQQLSSSVWQPTFAQSLPIFPFDHPHESWEKLTSRTWFTTSLWMPVPGCASYTDEWFNLPRPLPAPLPPDDTTTRPRQRGSTTARNGKDPKDAAARMMKTQIFPTKEQTECVFSFSFPFFEKRF